jgi:hypothetical protein
MCYVSELLRYFGMFVANLKSDCKSRRVTDYEGREAYTRLPKFDMVHNFLRSIDPNYLTNQPTAWSRLHLQKLIFAHLVRKFPAFYATEGFIPVFISVRHWSLSIVR